MKDPFIESTPLVVNLLASPTDFDDLRLTQSQMELLQCIKTSDRKGAIRAYKAMSGKGVVEARKQVDHWFKEAELVGVNIFLEDFLSRLSRAYFSGIHPQQSLDQLFPDGQ